MGGKSLQKHYFIKQGNRLAQVDIIKSKISEACEKADIYMEKDGLLADEILEIEFVSNVNRKMAEIEQKVFFSQPTIRLPQYSNMADQIQFQAPEPRLQCAKFNSCGVAKFEFKNFFVQFVVCVATVNSE